MKYITETLGVNTNIEPWQVADKLPYYLIDRYDFKKVILGDVACLFMKPKDEPDTLTAIKKHITKVRETEPFPVVLEFDGMTAQRRKSLIGARIPFVAPKCQIYLPFLGVSLNERYTSVKAPNETLMPSSQLLLFFYLYQNEPELYTGETADLFNLSAMQISRAIRQLTALGLVSVRKDGVRMAISSKECRYDLFERAKPYLLNPIRKRIYVERDALPKGLPLSGYSALSELTMLSDPETETFAFFGKVDALTGTDTLIDHTAQAEIEIWRYDPTLLASHSNVVDTLSMIASLLPYDDERIEQSIDELLKTLWR